MTGHLKIIQDNTLPQKHDHVDIIFKDIILRYNDVRRFGCILWIKSDLIANHRLFKHLGIEPLSHQFNFIYFSKILKTKKRAIKNVLMDQNIIVGIGNIYANEALFLSHIHPLKKSNLLTKKEINLLIKNIKSILILAIEKGGTTLKDFSDVEGKNGYFQQELHIYDKEGQKCPNCYNIIQKIIINNRSSFYCSECQVNT